MFKENSEYEGGVTMVTTGNQMKGIRMVSSTKAETKSFVHLELFMGYGMMSSGHFMPQVFIVNCYIEVHSFERTSPT